MRAKRSQKQRIADLLSDGRWHSTVDLHAICWRYGARLWDLRQEGCQFEKRRTEDPQIEEWRLVALPSGCPPTSQMPTIARERRQPFVATSGNARRLTSVASRAMNGAQGDLPCG